MFLQVLSVFIALATIIFTYFKRKRSYWECKKLNVLEADSVFGIFGNPLNRQESLNLITRKMYLSIRQRKWRHAGVYSMFRSIYVPADLEYVKNILTKDFQYFVDRGGYYNEKADPLSGHLFALGGTKWRNMRTKLTPTFTSGKMKVMFQTLVECEKNLHEVMEKLNTNNDAIDIKEVFACFTTDIIGSCAFGLDCNSFKGEDSPFRKYGKQIFKFSKWRILLLSLAGTFQNLGKLFGVRITEPDASDFFMKTVQDNVDYRQRNNVTRNDFMQLLIDMKNSKHLTMEEISAQAFLFFFAGFETSSTTSTFLLYELARHQEIQDKVRTEIVEVLEKHQGEVTYEAIQDLKYMNQVIDETLRMYSPLPFVTREAVKDYKIDGEDLVIEKGTRVMIPIIGIHYDPENYPDPEKFDPDRFAEEVKKSRHPYAHIPFGEGPRICIGLRFGIMQTKVGLVSLLKNYKFTVNEKTLEPLKMKVDSFVTAAEGEIWLNAEKL